MIAWHDNREINFGIYSARSLEGYDCNQEECERKMIEELVDDIPECNIVIPFSPTENGIYDFSLLFYIDNGLNRIYKTIGIEGAENRWLLDGVIMEDNLIYDGDTLLGIELEGGVDVNISYLPYKDDEIFDIVLYIRLKSVIN